MKNKIKRFFIEKKELLIFIGVVVLVFVSVITVSSLALKSDDKEVAKTIDPSTQTQEPSTVEPTQPTIVDLKFCLPVFGEYEVVREYYDTSYEASKLENAIINDGKAYKTSKGVGYAKTNKEAFDVVAIYDGEVVEVVDDELEGATIKIKHSDGVYSVYSSLADLKVNKGDKVVQGTILAKSSQSINDPDAGIHVFLEIIVNNKYVNPNSIIGKNMEEVALIK